MNPRDNPNVRGGRGEMRKYVPCFSEPRPRLSQVSFHPYQRPTEPTHGWAYPRQERQKIPSSSRSPLNQPTQSFVVPLPQFLGNPQSFVPPLPQHTCPPPLMSVSLPPPTQSSVMPPQQFWENPQSFVPPLPQHTCPPPFMSVSLPPPNPNLSHPPPTLPPPLPVCPVCSLSVLPENPTPTQPVYEQCPASLSLQLQWFTPRPITHTRTDMHALYKITTKAPRGCCWADVAPFMCVDGMNSPSYQEFLLSLLNQPVLHIGRDEDMVACINKDTLLAAMNDFRTWLYLKTQNDERQLQPAIHTTLICVAVSLGKLLGKMDYLVASEPSIAVEKDRLADESIFECIHTDLLLRMLFEIKGTNKYPYALQGAEHPIAQMLQEVALAYANHKWSKSILCGLVTASEWNLFIVETCHIPSRGHCLQITDCFRHCIPIGKEADSDQYNPETFQNQLENLIAFLMKWLIKLGNLK